MLVLVSCLKAASHQLPPVESAADQDLPNCRHHCALIATTPPHGFPMDRNGESMTVTGRYLAG